MSIRTCETSRLFGAPAWHAGDTANVAMSNAVARNSTHNNNDSTDSKHGAAVVIILARVIAIMLGFKSLPGSSQACERCVHNDLCELLAVCVEHARKPREDVSASGSSNVSGGSTVDPRFPL